MYEMSSDSSNGFSAVVSFSFSMVDTLVDTVSDSFCKYCRILKVFVLFGGGVIGCRNGVVSSFLRNWPEVFD